MRSGRAALRKVQELPEQYVPERETHHHRVWTTPERRQQKEEALETLEKKLQSLASLKVIHITVLVIRGSFITLVPMADKLNDIIYLAMVMLMHYI